MARITSEEVSHLALLCRIAMTEDDVELMRDQMSNILGKYRRSQPGRHHRGPSRPATRWTSYLSCAKIPSRRQPTGKLCC